MAMHKGQNGKVSIGAAFVGHLTNWSINEKAALHDQTAAEDAWGVSEAGIKTWSGSITMRLDHETDGNQLLRAGATLALELYSEGNASGKTYYSGDAILEDHGIASPYDGNTERTFSFTGTGALAIEAVA
jgi:hypothetical protein